jgi:hypothetical protein
MKSMLIQEIKHVDVAINIRHLSSIGYYTQCSDASSIAEAGASDALCGWMDAICLP